MRAVILQADDLHKSYHRAGEEIQALGGVTLTVEKGEFVAIVGPSGCGKSTLLHLLAGIDIPSAGQVLLNGIDLGGASAERRALLRRSRLGLLFQSPALLPGLTSGENVALPLALMGLGRLERSQRAAALLAMVGLDHRFNALPDDLSGGQRQRVALARALANEPEVVLADEPTGSLDSITASHVLDTLLAVLRQRGTALVMVTHDVQASVRADRVIRLRDGVISRSNHRLPSHSALPLEGRS